MLIAHQQQPDDVTCGHTVIAMLAGVAVREVIAAVGHTFRTRALRHKLLIEQLRKRGVQCGDRFVSRRNFQAWPRNAIARITWPNGKGHVVLKIDRTWHDPLHPRAFTGSLPLEGTYSNGGRVTSFLIVEVA